MDYDGAVFHRKNSVSCHNKDTKKFCNSLDRLGYHQAAAAKNL